MNEKMKKRNARQLAKNGMRQLVSNGWDVKPAAENVAYLAILNCKDDDTNTFRLNFGKAAVRQDGFATLS